MVRGQLAPLLLALVTACNARDLVVADEVTDSGSTDNVNQEEGGCIVNSDCDVGFYCERTNCDGPPGSCVEIPVWTCNADDTEKPVCGCAGSGTTQKRVTFWNACLRQLEGFSLVNDGSRGGIGDCELPTRCTTTGNECGVTDQSCARVARDPRGCMDAPGLCWKLPPTCPAADPDPRLQLMSCDSLTCSSRCDAIRSGVTHMPPGPPPDGGPGGPASCGAP